MSVPAGRRAGGNPAPHQLVATLDQHLHQTLGGARVAVAAAVDRRPDQVVAAARDDAGSPAHFAPVQAGDATIARTVVLLK